MRINHNISAMNAHRLLGVNNLAGSKTLEKLSSGKRINRAGDDAAGMAISEKMRAQIKGLEMASRNSLDGVSLVQTAEGAMNEIHSMLQRMRELSVQAANGTSADSDRQAIQDEINQLTSEVNRISNGTEYNTRNIMKGNEGPDSNTTVQTMSTGQPAVVSNDKSYNIKSSIDDLEGLIESYKFSVEELEKNAEKAKDAANAAGDTTAEGVAQAAENAANALATAAGTFETATGTFKGAADTYETAKSTYLTAIDTFEKAKLQFEKDGDTNAFNTATGNFNTATGNFNTAKGTYDTAVSSFDTAKGIFEAAVDTFKTDAGTFNGVSNISDYGKTLSKYSIDLAEGYKEITKSTDNILISESLQSETLTISVNGDEVNVNLAGFTGVEAGLTINDLLKRINDSITEGAEAIINETGNIEIKTIGAGGDQVIEVSGSAVSKIFGASTGETLKGRGVAENPARNSAGTFYFDKTPENGSRIKIGNEVIDIYDSSIEPYAGSNRAIDISDATGQKKTPEQIVKEIAETIQIDGITLSVETSQKAKEIRGNDSYSSKRLVIESNNKGFEGNLIALEGTLDGFNTNLQVGANTGQGFRLEIGDIRANALRISATEPSANPGVRGAAYVRMPNVTDGISSNMVEYAIDVTEENKASAAIKVFDNAIVQVAKERSKLGATQNRLEHTIANLDNTAENLTNAMARIEDTDMAKEMSEFQKLNVLQQAGISMLAQANQQPQSILKLLG